MIVIIIIIITIVIAFLYILLGISCVYCQGCHIFTYQVDYNFCSYILFTQMTPEVLSHTYLICLVFSLTFIYTIFHFVIGISILNNSIIIIILLTATIMKVSISITLQKMNSQNLMDFTKQNYSRHYKSLAGLHYRQSI